MNLKTFFTAVLIVLVCTTEAQNWKPIYENEVYNFSLTSSTNNLITNYLWIDSIRQNTTYLNTVIQKCDQCNEPDFWAEVLGCYKIKQAQFLQKEIVDRGNGIYQFHNPGNFYIYSTAKLGESWIFDSSRILTAEVINLDSKDFWGTTDSTKTIQLSTGEIIILSKNHGIIKFPNFADTT